MKLSFMQKAIIDSLKESPKTIPQLEVALNRSYQTIRSAILTLEAGGYIDRDDTRQPHLFGPAKKQGIDPAHIALVKGKLLKPSDADKKNPIYHAYTVLPKEEWLEVAKLSEVVSAAVKELNDEGKLIKTLEGSV